jgi:hypothetical protein
MLDSMRSCDHLLHDLAAGRLYGPSGGRCELSYAGR